MIDELPVRLRSHVRDVERYLVSNVDRDEVLSSLVEQIRTRLAELGDEDEVLAELAAPASYGLPPIDTPVPWSPWLAGGAPLVGLLCGAVVGTDGGLLVMCALELLAATGALMGWPDANAKLGLALSVSVPTLVLAVLYTL